MAVAAVIAVAAVMAAAMAQAVSMSPWMVVIETLAELAAPA